jgi:antitoxin component YwqK of YwqJK toxin-antitoxin module
MQDNNTLNIYVNGQRHGYWNRFFLGRIVGKGYYNNGNLQGYWKFYDHYNTLIKTIFYAQ